MRGDPLLPLTTHDIKKIRLVPNYQPSISGLISIEDHDKKIPV